MRRLSFCLVVAVVVVLAAASGIRAQDATPVLSAVSGRVIVAAGGFVPLAEPAAASACGSAAHCTVVSWTEATIAPAGYALTYNVFRGTASGGEGITPINSAPLTTTSYVDPVTLGNSAQTFYYEVEAVETGAIAQAATSSEVSATFPGILVAPAATDAVQ